ncbi:hypothetical protein VHEMI08167 [[Torrubiella] hemipterigena]|uniref:Metallo-beta-lactamase domain-containing protein n=1 Tax=[Torrubiella] hemipterigena TaxID=1531966 RepID=A0A0A1TMY2_9HYPO|nr:hypothetical protein VHEMI08167 [[Torrubiella] hemipterigena]
MSFQLEPYQPEVSNDYLICNTCGTQFPTTNRKAVKTCHICDDPRQYVPPSGQSFTTMNHLIPVYKNIFVPDRDDPRIIYIQTTPGFAINQRAILIKTPTGNVLWDCLTFLDADTINTIRKMGGLRAIAISHPHYYSTHADWARAFECPVYLASEDMEWTTQRSSHQVPVTDIDTDIFDTGVKLIKLGGHFDGSMVALFEGRLLIADTLMTSPSGIGKWDVNALGEKREKPPGLNSFSFLWSIPNRIPLSADEMMRMWRILSKYEFTSTHGAFPGMDITAADLKRRVLDSMQIQTKFMGWTEHPLMSETC